MNGWDILIGGGVVLMLVFAFRTATSKKGRCCGRLLPLRRKEEKTRLLPLTVKRGLPLHTGDLVFDCKLKFTGWT